MFSTGQKGTGHLLFELVENHADDEIFSELSTIGILYQEGLS